MVMVNYIHLNQSVPKGVMGGSICLCEECAKKRQPTPEKTAIEIMQEDMIQKKEAK